MIRGLPGIRTAVAPPLPESAQCLIVYVLSRQLRLVGLQAPSFGLRLPKHRASFRVSLSFAPAFRKYVSYLIRCFARSEGPGVRLTADNGLE